VDQLSSFASEVTAWPARWERKQARRQADVRGVAGTWKDLTDSVHSMAGNLTAAGRTSPRQPPRWRAATSRRDHRRRQGRDLGAEEHINTMVDHLELRLEVTRVARGRHRGQARRQAERQGLADVEGPHRRVNSMAGNLTGQVRTSPTSPPPSPTATSPRRSPSTSGGAAETPIKAGTSVARLTRARGSHRGEARAGPR